MSATASKLNRLFLAGMAAGCILLLLGLFWNALTKPEHYWSVEQASEFDEARVALHNLTYDRSHQAAESNSTDDARLQAMEAARERLGKIEANLAAARDSRERTGVWMTRLGLASLVLFGVGYLSSQGS